VESMLGNYYTAISVIIVYHLLLLQHWLDRVGDVDAAADEIRRTTSSNDLARDQLRQRCKRMLSSFPVGQILVVFVAFTTLCVLAVLVATNLDAVRYRYSMAPTVVMWLVYVAASITTWLQGRKVLGLAIGSLAGR
jgi:hypothetical protein